VHLLLCIPIPQPQELQDKSARLVDAERRFTRLEAVMQRIALRTGCPVRQQVQQRAGARGAGTAAMDAAVSAAAAGAGCAPSEWEGLDLASASLLAGGGGGAAQGGVADAARWCGGGGGASGELGAAAAARQHASRSVGAAAVAPSAKGSPLHAGQGGGPDIFVVHG
jgi:hypothetical protein